MAASSVFNAICEKFEIETLTENQKRSIKAIIDGKDVFVGTKTGSGKSLTYESFPVVSEGGIVLVIAPLLSIMSEQCTKLEKLGFTATYIGKDLTENENIVNGMYNFVFGSPEVLVGDLKWREVLKSEVYEQRVKLIVVDEAHTVVQWGESSTSEEPFREWFSKIGELRSLCPAATMVALTATAGPSQRRKIMKLLCFRANSEIILESPDRQNIKISTICIPNKDILENVFQWLLEKLKQERENTPRYIIFCERISDVSKIYSMFLRQFGHNCELFQMYHSKTSDRVKEKIRHDLTVDGKIRVLICTNAAGMGVNFYNVNNIVHYNLPRDLDTFVQQMGRAGRDGSMSHELIMYKTHKTHLKKVENDLVRLAKDNTKCRHELLCEAYLIKHGKIMPSHNCCDVCDKTCKCGKPECPCTHDAFLVDTSADNNSSDEDICRPVNEEERMALRQKLVTFRYTLTSSTAGTVMDSDIIHGLTDEIVDKIVENCGAVFTASDVMQKFPIWSYGTAVEICNIICDVFGDVDMYNLLEDTEEESS